MDWELDDLAVMARGVCIVAYGRVGSVPRVVRPLLHKAWCCDEKLVGACDLWTGLASVRVQG